MLVLLNLKETDRSDMNNVKRRRFGVHTGVTPG